MEMDATTLEQWSYGSESRESFENERKPGLLYLIVVRSLFALSFGGIAVLMYMKLPAWTYFGPAIAFVAMAVIGQRKSDEIKATGARCTKCSKRMTKVCVPLPPDNLDSISLKSGESIVEVVEGDEGRLYLRLLYTEAGGRSGSAHPKIQELRQVWYTCQSCKQAFLADTVDRVDIGKTAADITAREAQHKKHRHLRQKYAGKTFKKG